MSKRSRNSGLVYSTDHGRMCPDCGQPEARCTCGRGKGSEPARGARSQKARPRGGSSQSGGPQKGGGVRVGRETKGRKGKGVSVVTGLPLAGAELEQLARQLKQRCGAGGTVRDGAIEIQGEHRDTLVAELEKLGYDARRSGG